MTKNSRLLAQQNVLTALFYFAIISALQKAKKRTKRTKNAKKENPRVNSVRFNRRFVLVSARA